MERVRIKELQLRMRSKKERKVSNKEIAHAVLGDEVAGGAGRGVKGEPLSDSRKQTLISEWDNGKSLSAIKPRHILRLAKLFGVTNVNDLLESDEKI